MQDLLGSLRNHLVREGREDFFSVQDTLRDTVQVLSAYARERQARLVLEPFPDAQLFGDSIAFVQVMSNLMSNAIQAYPAVDAPSDVCRDVCVRVTESNGEVCISVQDTGQGIAQEGLSHIFEPFYTTKDKHGIGLGLSLAKRIIENDFHGRIIVDSMLGEGSTFTACFPVRKP
jgi:two-component system C4-dicarboxylate transport sensor histidine kinase DctB